LIFIIVPLGKLLQH